MSEGCKNILIQSVKEAIEVCYTAPKNRDQGYPYATGYARSCLQRVLEHLTTDVEGDIVSNL